MAHKSVVWLSFEFPTCVCHWLFCANHRLAMLLAFMTHNLGGAAWNTMITQSFREDWLVRTWLALEKRILTSQCFGPISDPKLAMKPLELSIQLCRRWVYLPGIFNVDLFHFSFKIYLLTFFLICQGNCWRYTKSCGGSYWWICSFRDWNGSRKWGLNCERIGNPTSSKI